MNKLVSFNKISVGLAAIAGCSSYGIWRHRKKNQSEFLVLDPNEAVENLNQSKMIGASIKSLEGLCHLNSHKCKDVISGLNHVGWATIAIHGSDLSRYKMNILHPGVVSEMELNNLLQKIELDKNWKRAIHWYTRNVCPEDNLYCNEELNKPARIKRLHSLLHVLLFKSGFEDCEKLIEQNVHNVLLHLLLNHRDEDNKNLVISVMKIIGNIALYSDKCAEAIAESRWMSLLTEMMMQPVLSEEPVLAHRILANMLYSFGSSDYKLSPGVYELVRPKEEAVMDVVFVHGFRGSLFRTWRQKDKSAPKTVRFWPREWLPKEDIKQPIRIIGLDYASKLLQFGEAMDNVENRAKKLQAAMDGAKIGSKPVVFIVHSMGGLIVKDMLSKNENLRRNTVGILFYATPHRGTPVIANYLRYLRPTEDTKLLRIDSELNRELHNRFLEVCDDIPLIVNVVEVKKAPLFGRQRLIVPSDSAFFERGAVYHSDEHHYEINKPESIFSLSYCVALNFIKDALRIIAQKNQ